MLTRLRRSGARAFAALLALQLAGSGPALAGCGTDKGHAVHRITGPVGEPAHDPSAPCPTGGAEEEPGPECLPGPLCLTSLPGPARPDVPVLLPGSEAAAGTPAVALKPAPSLQPTPPPRN